MLKIRTGPECPEDNLRELTNCGIAREREKGGGKRKERENFPMKGSDLGDCWARSQNKGLSEYQRRASWLWTSPSPTRGREAGGRQTELEGEGQTQPQRWHPLPNCKQAPSC